MKISLSMAITCILITFCTVFFLNIIQLFVEIQRVDTYHHAIVNEIESSDFSPFVIQESLKKSPYHLQIEEKSVKDDLRIYEVTTRTTVSLPILGYKKEYLKQSIAR